LEDPTAEGKKLLGKLWVDKESFVDDAAAIPAQLKNGKW